MPGLGEVETGYNGVVGWSLSPIAGPVLLEGAQLKQIATQAARQSHSGLKMKTLSARARTEIEGKTVAPVQMAP